MTLSKIWLFRRIWYGKSCDPSIVCKFRWWLQWQIKSLYNPNYQYFNKHGHWPVDENGRIKML